MALPDVFSTARLRAERLTSDHLPDLLRFHSDRDVMAELGGVRTLHQTTEYLARNLQHWSDHGFGVWILRGTDRPEVVGRAVLRCLRVSGVNEVEIGYAFYPQFWGRGLATEIAAACLDLARRRLHLGSVIAVTTPRNTGSQRVLLKLGFLPEQEIVHEGTRCALFRIRWPRRTRALTRPSP